MRNTKILKALQGKINNVWHFLENYQSEKNKTVGKNSNSSTNDTDDRCSRKTTLNYV